MLAMKPFFVRTVRPRVYAIVVCVVARRSCLHVQSFLGGTDMIHQTFPAYSFAHECGSWCLPTLTPQSLRQSCHEIVVVHQNSYLTGLVVFNADLPLRPVAHGNRGGFIFCEIDSEHELGVALQVTA